MESWFNAVWDFAERAQKVRGGRGGGDNSVVLIKGCCVQCGRVVRDADRVDGEAERQTKRWENQQILGPGGGEQLQEMA